MKKKKTRMGRPFFEHREDVRTAKLEVRLTPAERERFDAYAERHDLTLSETLRMFLAAAEAEEREHARRSRQEQFVRQLAAMETTPDYLRPDPLVEGMKKLLLERKR